MGCEPELVSPLRLGVSFQAADQECTSQQGDVGGFTSPPRKNSASLFYLCIPTLTSVQIKSLPTLHNLVCEVLTTISTSSGQRRENSDLQPTAG